LNLRFAGESPPPLPPVLVLVLVAGTDMRVEGFRVEEPGGDSVDAVARHEVGARIDESGVRIDGAGVASSMSGE